MTGMLCCYKYPRNPQEFFAILDILTETLKSRKINHLEIKQ